MNPSDRQSGFSLIEVMVAVLILGVAIVGLTRGISTALASSKEAELYSQAAQVAANRVELLRADGDFVDGEMEGDAGAYHWRQKIVSTSIAGLHEVEITVNRGSGAASIYTLQTLLYLATTDSTDDGRGRPRRRPESKRGHRRSGGTQ